MKRKSFTLVELMVVIAIVIVLAAIAIPSYINMAKRAKKSRVVSDMAVLATGLGTYYTDWGKYPITEFAVNVATVTDIFNKELVGTGTVNQPGEVSLTGEEGGVSYIGSNTLKGMDNPFYPGIEENGIMYVSDGGGEHFCLFAKISDEDEITGFNPFNVLEVYAEDPAPPSEGTFVYRTDSMAGVDSSSWEALTGDPEKFPGTLPVPIANFANTETTATTATFTWAAATGATSVVLQESLTGASVWSTATTEALTSTSTMGTVTGLTEETAYDFQLVVIGGAFAGTSNMVTNLIISGASSEDIINVGISGLIAPATGESPQIVGALVAGAATYNVTSLIWNPVEDPYLIGKVYTATIELTSAIGYKFPVGGLTPIVNVGTPAVGLVGGGDVSGNTLTFTVSFLETIASVWTHDEGMITGYVGTEGVVTVPAVLDGIAITSIDSYAFDYNEVFTNVTIPSGIINIGEGAFEGCIEMTEIIVNSSNSAYSSVNGVLFNKVQTLLIQYPGGKTGSYVIPDGVINIGFDSFGYCVGLTDVTIPNSVLDIGDMAFYDCEGLANVVFGNSVTNIGDSAFEGCLVLANVDISDNATSIGDSAFGYCSSLISVTIPDSITSIGDNAFQWCEALTSVVIPSGITVINDSTFMYCTALTSVTIPNGVTNINWGAFNSCYALDDVAIPNSVTIIGDRAFVNCATLTSITIPNSVTTIGSYAFWDCTSLTSVTIGGGVTSISDKAFYRCADLSVANFLGNAPIGTVAVFESCKTGFYIHRLPGATGWGSTWYGFAVQSY